MSIHHKIAAATMAIALGAAPAAIAAPAGSGNGHGHGHAYGHSGTQPTTAQRKAYGKYCVAESKRHSDAAPGTKGTPFSQCVTAMAHAAASTKAGTKPNPHRLCAAQGLSKKHSDAAPGTTGTPYSQCVRGAERLIKASRSSSSTPVS